MRVASWEIIIQYYRKVLIIQYGYYYLYDYHRNYYYLYSCYYYLYA